MNYFNFYLRRKMIKYILDLIYPKSVHEKEEEYIKKNGYPKETVVFTDHYGRMSQLVGSEVFRRTAEKLKKYKNR